MQRRCTRQPPHSFNQGEVPRRLHQHDQQGKAQRAQREGQGLAVGATHRSRAAQTGTRCKSSACMRTRRAPALGQMTAIRPGTTLDHPSARRRQL